MQFKFLLAIFAVVMAICAFAPAEVQGETTFFFDECNSADVCWKCCESKGHTMSKELTSFEFGCVCEQVKA